MRAKSLLRKLFCPVTGRSELQHVLLTYFHHRAITSQNSSSHTLMTKAELKSQSHFEQTLYFGHYCCYLFIYFKNVTMFFDGNINQLGETVLGSHRRYWDFLVVKLGQCQTLQPWLPDFLSKKTHSLMH